MSEKEREILAGENDKRTQDLQRKVKEQLGINTEIAGKGCLRMTAGEAMKVVEFFERMDKKTEAELRSIKKDVF